MPNAITDLLKSGATLWFGETSATTPTENTAMASASGFTSLGWTQEGVVAKFEQERMKIYVDELLSPVEERIIGNECMFETTLAEVNADMLALALGADDSDVTDTAAGASQVAVSSHYLNAANSLVKKWKIVLEGTRYGATDVAHPVRILCTRATIKINGDLNFQKRGDNYLGVPIVVTALVDTANSNRPFGFQFVTAPASS